MVFDGRYKYVSDPEEPMLFDVEADPQELDNLAGTLPEVESRLQRVIEEWLESTPPVLPPNPQERPARVRRAPAG